MRKQINLLSSSKKRSPMGRVLPMLFCASMIVGLMPTSVSAKVAEEDYPYVAGVQITDTNAGNVLGDGTVSYDAETNVLTLRSADIETADAPYGIYAEGDLVIELAGKNTVTVSPGETPLDTELYAAVYSKAGNVRIIAGEDETGASLNAEVSVPLENGCDSVGIKGNDVSIEAGVNVTVKSGDSSYEEGKTTYSISGNSVSIKGAVVYAEAGDGCYSAAIAGQNEVEIENSDVNAVSTSDYFEGYAEQSYGIFVSGDEGLHISGGKVIAQSNAAESISADIACMGGSISIDNNAVVQANFEDEGYASDCGAGLLAEGDIIIDNAQVFARGREAASSVGIYSYQNVILNGDVTAIGGRSDAKSISDGGSYGILAETGAVTINGGSVNASVGMVESAVCGGICADGDVTVNGGEISAVGSVAVPVDGVDANFGSGIISMSGDVVFAGENAKVTASGGYATEVSAGIYAMNGNVKFQAGEVIFDGYYPYDESRPECYGVIAAKVNEPRSIAGNVILSGGTVQGLGLDQAAYLDGEFIVDPAANCILTVKAEDELTGEFDPWEDMQPHEAYLDTQDGYSAWEEYLNTQNENAEEIEGAPFAKKTVIPLETVNNWKYFSCTVQTVEAVNYTLTFNTNGGSSIDPVIEKEGTVVELSAYTPVRDGFTFAGWYSDEALMDKVTTVTLDSDKTVYADWTANKQEEVKPSEPDNKDTDVTVHNDTPETGGSNNIMLWIGLLSVSGAGTIVTIAINKKRKYAK